MYTIDLAGKTFRDKVMGCWMGKNCGGTLGTPVETAWGQEEMYDIWWYPELRSGGLPNDDLEMQLVWLETLRAKGPGMVAADLAQAWIDHIGYNFDEYGLNKANLRLGLQPPVSGAWNNWFVDCMGCPIRSEVWACVAPGVPRAAARYAYEDGICDHAGGESIFGELFNVAVQSAAFVVDDPQLLLDIGLSYLPETSQTWKAVTVARKAYADGLDWKRARALVLEATPSPIAQYSPINLGFQVIGWLYGTDFGDALCKTVNCGYDTDSSGGSIGSWLGIRAGLSNLPRKWVEPFGLGLSTNESWGGVRHLTDGTRSIPSDITELTEEVVELAPGVLRHHGIELEGSVVVVEESSLFADDSIRELWDRSAWQIRQSNRGVEVVVDYMGNAAARPGELKELGLQLANRHPDPVTVRVETQLPQGWPAMAAEEVRMEADSVTRIPLRIQVPDRATVGQRNIVRVAADVIGHPAGAGVPIALPGAQAWRVYQGRTDGAIPTSLDSRGEPGPEWTEITVDANRLPLADLVEHRDDVVLQTFLEAVSERQVRLAVDCTTTTTVWLNGEVIIDVKGPRLIRPSYGVGEAVNPVVSLTAGFNELIVHLQRPEEGVSGIEGHTFLSTADRLRDGIVDVGRTRFPWDR